MIDFVSLIFLSVSKKIGVEVMKVLNEPPEGRSWKK
jgi:hypothetical protein